MTENFGETPEDFNLDDWIDQGTRPQRTVKVYRDWSLMDKLSKLEGDIAAADKVEDPGLGDMTASELREQYEKVLDELEASAMPVTLRSLTNDEAVAITGGIPDVEQTFIDQKGEKQTRLKPDRAAIGDAMVAAAAVSPVMTRDQVRKMRERLGDGPTLVLYTTVTELRTAGTELPSVSFSPASSGDSQE